MSGEREASCKSSCEETETSDETGRKRARRRVFDLLLASRAPRVNFEDSSGALMSIWVRMPHEILHFRLREIFAAP